MVLHPSEMAFFTVPLVASDANPKLKLKLEKSLHLIYGTQIGALMPVKSSQLGWLANVAGCRLLVVEVREGTQA